MKKQKIEPLMNLDNSYFFDINETTEVVSLQHTKYSKQLSHYAELVKSIVHDKVIFHCRSYRKDNLSCMKLTLKDSHAECVIDFIESGKIDIPEYSECFIKSVETQRWHSTWHLIDNVDMFYVACFIADFLDADLDSDNAGNQLDFLMIQDVQHRRIKELY